MKYVPSWKHTALNFRRRLKHYAKIAEKNTQSKGKDSGTQPVLAVVK